MGIRASKVTAQEQQAGTAICSHLYRDCPAGLPHATCHLYSSLHSLDLVGVGVNPWHWWPSAWHLVIQKYWFRPTVTELLLTSTALYKVSQSLLLLHALIGKLIPGGIWRYRTKNIWFVMTCTNKYLFDWLILFGSIGSSYHIYLLTFFLLNYKQSDFSFILHFSTNYLTF